MGFDNSGLNYDGSRDDFLTHLMVWVVTVDG